MNLTEFTTAVAQLVDGKPDYDIVLADGDSPVSIQWGAGLEPDHIIVQTEGGDVFQVKVERLLVEGDS